MIKCDYADERERKNNRDGWCKWKEAYCNGDGYELCWFTDELTEVEPKDVCCKNSIFGNFYFGITKEQLEALKNGAILYACDEYGMFIKYVGSDDENEN